MSKQPLIDYAMSLLTDPRWPNNVLPPPPDNTLSLFDQHPVRGKQPTSQEAAEQIKPLSAAMRARVYDLLLEAGSHGRTDEEMQTELEMNANTQRPRRQELVQAKMVVESDRFRPTVAGRTAIVWVASRYKNIDGRTRHE